MSGFPTSIGQSTNTLADTSARHHIVGRLCTSMYQSITDPNSVITNKHDFCAVREELALALGRSYNSKLGISPGAGCKGPVPVITNIAPFKSNGGVNDLMSWYIKLYDTRSIAEMRNHISTACVVKNESFFPPELYFGGFIMNANAQAHPINGDTAVTLFIGGIITVKNGRFPVKGGDEVQWYFDEEADAGMFDHTSDGLRVTRAATSTIFVQHKSPDAASYQAPDKQNTLDRMQVRQRDHSYGERARTKQITKVKSCRPGIDGNGATMMDWKRVFGIATGDAAPFEKVDIKVCRQSL